MDDEIGRLRAEARRLAQGKPRSQVRYSAGFRGAAVQLARRRLGQGSSVARLARVLRDMRKRGNLDRLPGQLSDPGREGLRLLSATRRL